MTKDEGGSHSDAQQRSFWNDWNIKARSGDTLRDAMEARRAAVFNALEHLDSKAPKILEVGCGTGWLSKDLATYGSVVGVDIADEAIEMAGKRVPEGQFFAGDFMQVDLPLGHFDTVVCLETLSHVPDQQAFIDRLADMLVPDGILILTTQNRSIMIYADVIPPAPGLLRRWVSMAELKQMLRPRFDLIRAATAYPPSGNRGILRLVNSVKLNALAEKIWSPETIRRFLERLGLGEALVVLARRRR